MESKYRAIATIYYKLCWLKVLLQDYLVHHAQPATLKCKEAAIHIATNPVFHECTKLIELDCHLVLEKL